jgi:hypothetical protein
MERPKTPVDGPGPSDGLPQGSSPVWNKRKSPLAVTAAEASPAPTGALPCPQFYITKTSKAGALGGDVCRKSSERLRGDKRSTKLVTARPGMVPGESPGRGFRCCAKQTGLTVHPQPRS